MSAKGYTTKAKVERYLLTDIDTSFNTQVDEWIEGVERIIDQITGRNFIADDEPSSRVFDGDGTEKLLIDEAVEVSQVEIGNDSYGSSFSIVPNTGAGRYFTEPGNHVAKKVPISAIVLSAGAFPTGMQNNRITAKWGYSAAVPEDISFVATIFVAGIINQHRQGGDEIKSESIGNYSVTYNTDKENNSWSDFENAKRILDTYKRYLL